MSLQPWGINNASEELKMFFFGVLVGVAAWVVFRFFGSDIDRGFWGFIFGSAIYAGVLVLCTMAFGWFSGSIVAALITAAGVQLPILVLNLFTRPIEAR